MQAAEKIVTHPKLAHSEPVHHGWSENVPVCPVHSIQEVEFGKEADWFGQRSSRWESLAAALSRFLPMLSRVWSSRVNDMCLQISEFTLNPCSMFWLSRRCTCNSEFIYVQIWLFYGRHWGSRARSDCYVVKSDSAEGITGMRSKTMSNWQPVEALLELALRPWALRIGFVPFV
jgi:hypothetical protein